MTKCPYCGEEFKNYNGLSKHIFKYKAHGCSITKERLLCDTNYGGNRPKCKCGCGEYTEVGYNGDFWHANPTKYDRNNLYESQKRKVSKDNIKSEYCKNHGINVIVVLESDYKENKEDVIMKIKNKITLL